MQTSWDELSDLDWPPDTPGNMRITSCQQARKWENWFLLLSNLFEMAKLSGTSHFPQSWDPFQRTYFIMHSFALQNVSIMPKYKVLFSILDACQRRQNIHIMRTAHMEMQRLWKFWYSNKTSVIKRRTFSKLERLTQNVSREIHLVVSSTFWKGEPPHALKVAYKNHKYVINAKWYSTVYVFDMDSSASHTDWLNYVFGRL